MVPSDKLPLTLDVKALRVAFPTREGVVSAIDGLSLQVAPGEIVGLVGESGSGKSTAALALMRLIPKPGRITGGQILLEGQDILGLDANAMRALRGPGVAMVFQDALTALDPRMTVGRQIMEPLMIHLDLARQVARRRAIELLEEVGISSPETRIDQYPHELSGGMRQRVMIALALSCEPRLLVADEPTTALDVTVQRQILDLIMRMRDRNGTAVILITHDVGVVGEVCDRVNVMYAGRVVETGLVEDIFAKPKHPYTAGLLNSTIEPGSDRQQRLRAIPGLPPELTRLPAGCAFAPRCPHASQVCIEQRPMLTAAGESRQSACWHWDEV